MFIVIGSMGVTLLVFALLFDDLLDGIIPENPWLSTTAIATFLTAFGFGTYLIDSTTALPSGVAAAGGLGVGVGFGFVAFRWSRSLANMATDATPTVSDLVGCRGRVVTPIAPGSTGEAIVQLAGQPVKITAVASDNQGDEIGLGTEIVVVQALSPSRVEVTTAEMFWH
ncbi:MAG: hypothetical protein GY939_07875 [Actinomycetia bacterium]|nr:hypothetical protein [Actinomycetes bacterium]